MKKINNRRNESIRHCVGVFFVSIFFSLMWFGAPNVAWAQASYTTVVCDEGSKQHEVQLTPDGTGGAIIVWRDDRTGNNDVYAQRLDRDGNRLWPSGAPSSNGIPVCTAANDQTLPQIVADGQGGAIVIWQDTRGGGFREIYGQRLNADGALLWPAGSPGVAGQSIFTGGAAHVNDARLVMDGAGGAIVSWELGGIIYAQRVNSDGARQWNLDGVMVCNVDNSQTVPVIAADGAGGAVLAWEDARAGGGTVHIYAERISAAGDRLWSPGAPNGVPVCTTLSDNNVPLVASDGSGGAVVVWLGDNGAIDPRIRAQRLDSNGNIQWDDPPTPVNNTAGVADNHEVREHRMLVDAAGGTLVVWVEDLGGEEGWTLMAQYLDRDGNKQWTTPDGLVVTEAEPDSVNEIARFDAGEFFVAWMENRISDDHDHLFCNRLDSDGAKVWGAGDVAVQEAGSMDPVYFMPVPDGAGGVILAWIDDRNGFDNSDVFASRFPGPPPTVTTVTPPSAGNSGPVTITDLNGANFHNGSTVTLGYSGTQTSNNAPASQPNIAGANVSVNSYSQITCTFDITGATPGWYDITVQLIDGQSGTLVRGFQVTAANTYTVTFSAGQGGQIEGETTQTVVAGGDCDPVTAQADPWYLFSSWDGLGDSSGNRVDHIEDGTTLTVTNVNSDMNVVANFALNTTACEDCGGGGCFLGQANK